MIDHLAGYKLAHPTEPDLRLGLQTLLEPENEQRNMWQAEDGERGSGAARGTQAGHISLLLRQGEGKMRDRRAAQ